ncbi:MAG: hypothetical protein E7353_09980 [Clostridiales bacterium]|nr:hypothetical protein [Clostridiales bacterium]
MAKLPVMQSAKWCANCVYWAGERTLEPFFGRAEVSSDCQAKGMCMHQRGYYRQQVGWMGTCNQFEKHPIIKS